MKTFIYSLFFLLTVNTVVFGYNFTVTPNSLDFGSVNPNQAWSEDISHPSWYQSSTLNFYITYSVEEINNHQKLYVYSYFINKQHPDYPTDPQKVAVLNAVDSRVNGLSGLINFATINTANVYDSYLPVRLKVSSATSSDNYTGKYTNIENEKWIWLQDNNNAKVFDRSYAKIWNVNEYNSSSSLHYCKVLLKASITDGKAGGNYKGLLRFLADTQ
jgi:hypothetical protein